MSPSRYRFLRLLFAFLRPRTDEPIALRHAPQRGQVTRWTFLVARPCRSRLTPSPMSARSRTPSCRALVGKSADVSSAAPYSACRSRHWRGRSSAVNPYRRAFLAALSCLGCRALDPSCEDKSLALRRAVLPACFAVRSRCPRSRLAYRRRTSQRYSRRKSAQINPLPTSL